ncbi:FecR domain-containing protein [Rapidithrix thailandica]|uniref:FecR domain-containing protein n=1 Tax=Rapidithrix thailandica TaxID=413964 RepID=A0AAW9SDK7_9BACT
MDERKIKEELTVKFITGEISEEEREVLLQWIDASEANFEYFRELKESWDLLGLCQEETTSYNAEGSWKQFRQSVSSGSPLVKKTHFKVHRKAEQKHFSWIKIASMIGLLFVSGWGLYYFNTLEIQEEAGVQWVTKYNPAGSKSNFYLADGTEVKLNAESSLRYPEKFTGKNRSVYLEGEAFFDVKRDTLMPFIIRAGNTRTQVLGTSFSISAYPEENVTSVALATGKVQVNIEGESPLEIHLIPGEKAVYQRISNELGKRPFDPDKEFGWRIGNLVFEEDGMTEIVKKLSRWYGVTIHLENPQNREVLINTSYSQQALEAVLKSLSYSLNFNYQIKGKEVWITMF